MAAVWKPVASRCKESNSQRWKKTHEERLPGYVPLPGLCLFSAEGDSKDRRPLNLLISNWKGKLQNLLTANHGDQEGKSKARSHYRLRSFTFNHVCFKGFLVQA